MALTNTEVLKAKPGLSPVKMADGRGLYLLITPTGSKLWRWKYRFLGKEKLMAVGAYPDVSLAQARDKVDEARKQLATGSDPMAALKFEKIARRLAVEDTFAAVAKKWWESWKAARSDSHTVYVWRRLEADVFPAFGLRPVAEIEAPELVAMMKAIEKRGALDIAKRALQTCSQSFRYAIAHGLAKRNPDFEIRLSDVPTSRKSRTARGTTARNGLNCCARSRFTTAAPSHPVPLSTRADTLLRSLHTLSGHSALLFPGECERQQRSQDSHPAHGVNKALAKNGAKRVQ